MQQDRMENFWTKSTDVSRAGRNLIPGALTVSVHLHVKGRVGVMWVEGRKYMYRVLVLINEFCWEVGEKQLVVYCNLCF